MGFKDLTMVKDMPELNSFDPVKFLETTKYIATMFDAVWYQKRYQDVEDTELNMLEHFLIYGMAEGRAPNAIFDASYYRARRYNEINKDPICLLSYLNQGWRDLRNPSPLLNTNWYFQQLTKRGIPLEEPTAHFRNAGWKIGLTPHPLFEPAFYLRENNIDLEDGEDPLTHYILKGSLARLRTTQHFDPEWYRDAYQDVREAFVDPLMHYLIDGYLEGRNPTILFDVKAYVALNDKDKVIDIDPLSYFFIEGLNKRHQLPDSISYTESLGIHKNAISLSSLAQVPLVSIIIANFNGSHHLDELFNSLHNQSYNNFEVIFVDDGSSDDSVDKARRLKANKIVELPRRLGFTGANNAGLTFARGELIALLNNDTHVNEGWLESLVSRISQDSKIGAVTSKIRFWSKFHRIRLSCRNQFELNISDTLKQLAYKKIFLRSGSQINEIITSVKLGDDTYMVEVDISFRDHDISFLVRDLAGGSGVTVSFNGFDYRAGFSQLSGNDYSLTISKEILQKPRNKGFYVINNAGSVADNNGMPVDRGLSETDSAQYDVAEEVPYLCGCSAIIRRDALQGRVLFLDDFFAYYEDSELSLRLRRQGYIIFYEPASIVYHKHSSTTLEKSLFWRRYTMRNRVLFQYILNYNNNPKIIETSLSHFNHLRMWYQSQANALPSDIEFAKDLPSICEEILDIVKRLDAGETPRRMGRRAGIFNPYWSTLGGGEAHALHVACVLAETEFVDLISTTDFDIEELCEYFGVSSERLLKRVVKEMTSAITVEYDTFVNSCYASSLVSRAKTSYYLVSFPHTKVSRNFLKSYKFLPNSDFTKMWMSKYWGTAESSVEILNPMVGKEFFATEKDFQQKKKIILSVGRFASSGHIKSQLEIAEAFRTFSQRRVTNGQWKLMLIGSVNDPNYLSSVYSLLAGLNFEIVTNANFDVVVSAYKEAALYVHASGIGQSPLDHPELQEHFGMAVAQAVCSGCLPIVFDAAGPADIVADAGYGHVYSSVDELADILSKIAKNWETEKMTTIHYSKKHAAGETYSLTNFKNKVRRIFATEPVANIDADRYGTSI